VSLGVDSGLIAFAPIISSMSLLVQTYAMRKEVIKAAATICDSYPQDLSLP